MHRQTPKIIKIDSVKAADKTVTIKKSKNTIYINKVDCIVIKEFGDTESFKKESAHAVMMQGSGCTLPVLGTSGQSIAYPYREQGKTPAPLNKKLSLLKIIRRFGRGSKYNVSFQNKLLRIIRSSNLTSVEERILTQRAHDMEAFLHPKSNKCGLVHGDYHDNNIINNGDKTTVIDFEYSGIGNPLWDEISICAKYKLFLGLSDEEMFKASGISESDFSQILKNFKHRLIFSALVTLNRSRNRPELKSEANKRIEAAILGYADTPWLNYPCSKTPYNLQNSTASNKPLHFTGI